MGLIDDGERSEGRGGSFDMEGVLVVVRVGEVAVEAGVAASVVLTAETLTDTKRFLPPSMSSSSSSSTEPVELEASSIMRPGDGLFPFLNVSRLRCARFCSFCITSCRWWRVSLRVHAIERQSPDTYQDLLRAEDWSDLAEELARRIQLDQSRRSQTQRRTPSNDGPEDDLDRDVSVHFNPSDIDRKTYTAREHMCP